MPTATAESAALATECGAEAEALQPGGDAPEADPSTVTSIRFDNSLEAPPGLLGPGSPELARFPYRRKQLRGGHGKDPSLPLWVAGCGEAAVSVLWNREREARVSRLRPRAFVLRLRSALLPPVPGGE